MARDRREKYIILTCSHTKCRVSLYRQGSTWIFSQVFIDIIIIKNVEDFTINDNTIIIGLKVTID